MSEGNVFKYYYGQESDLFSFIRIPKLLLFDPKFEDLSLGAIVLYGLLLDRMGLSSRHDWIDEEGRVYIRYKIKNIEDDLKMSEKTATKHLAELEKIGLVEKVKMGLGQGNILYVKNFISEDLKNKAFITGKNYGNEKSKNEKDFADSVKIMENIPESEAREASKHHMPVEIAGNGAVDFGGNVAVENSGNETVNFGGHSNTEINNNKYNNNPISSNQNKYFEIYLSRIKRDYADDGIGWIDENNRARIFREGIRKQIQYDYLEECEDVDIRKVDELVEQMVEVMLDDSPKIRVSRQEFDSEYVKSRMFCITREHINYMLMSLRNTTTKVGNIKSYLRTTIFNSLATIGNYYSAEVNHAMYALAE